MRENRAGDAGEPIAKADVLIRPAGEHDDRSIWRVIEPPIRAGETLMLPRDMSEAEAVRYWRSPGHEVFVAEQGDGDVLGTYYLRANQQGGGAHVANCGYATAPAASGRGVARAMCAHSLERARARGFRAMQFNCVVGTNERAVRLWRSFGFETVGRLPGAFLHPRLGLVDALVMHRAL
jgi:ribosomal protein S18 acetylase RimI-like enzyme